MSPAPTLLCGWHLQTLNERATNQAWTRHVTNMKYNHGHFWTMDFSILPYRRHHKLQGVQSELGQQSHRPTRTPLKMFSKWPPSNCKQLASSCDVYCWPVQRLCYTIYGINWYSLTPSPTNMHSRLHLRHNVGVALSAIYNKVLHWKKQLIFIYTITNIHRVYGPAQCYECEQN